MQQRYRVEHCSTTLADLGQGQMVCMTQLSLFRLRQQRGLGSGRRRRLDRYVGWILGLGAQFVCDNVRVEARLVSPIADCADASVLQLDRIPSDDFAASVRRLFDNRPSFGVLRRVRVSVRQRRIVLFDDDSLRQRCAEKRGEHEENGVHFRAVCLGENRTKETQE